MPVLTRALARQFRAVLRKSLPQSLQRSSPVRIHICSTTDNLTLSAVDDGIGVRIVVPGTQAPADFGFPATVLNEVEGRDDSPVTIELSAGESGIARWTDRGVPRVIDFERCRSLDLPGWPDPPETTATFESAFLAALANAADVTARDATRYALHRVQLRGQTGEIIATDSKHLLVQRGFRLPWAENLIVPRLAAWDSGQLPTDAPVIVGKSTNAVSITVGPWSFALKIDEEGRYPDYRSILPKVDRATTVQLTDADANFLRQSVPRLPEGDTDPTIVTLDLGKSACVRAAAGGRVVEAVASTATVTGPPVLVAVDRRHLLKALDLGLRSICVARPELPLLCRDNRQLYVCMPLDRQYVVPATQDALRVESSAAATSNGTTSATMSPTMPRLKVAPVPSPTIKETRIMPVNHANHAESANGHAAANGTPDLIVLGEQVRAALVDANSKVVNLLAALRQQKKQTRAVEAAMASLRRLQTIER